MELKIGTVTSNTSINKDGTFHVSFGLFDSEEQEPISELVTYVSPYGNNRSGFVAIPAPGSLVICAYISSSDPNGAHYTGYYYLGSIMGYPVIQNQPSDEKVEEGKVADTNSVWPFKFRGMYDGKEVYPEQIGMTNARGDNFLMSSRYRPEEFEGDQMQDYRIQMESGSGKCIRLVDGPEVDGIIMSNEHVGKDFFIFSSSNSTKGNFSEGEWFLRTHGPINMYTTQGNIRHWVQEGYNLQLENLATGEYGYTKGGLKPNAVISTDSGPASSRVNNVGNETWGCIEIRSAHNNVIIEALAEDSVIRIEAPGSNTKIIINTGGTVDIVADKKITLQSNEEIEINAPIVDINGSQSVFIDNSAGPINLNLPDTPPAL